MTDLTTSSVPDIDNKTDAFLRADAIVDAINAELPANLTSP